MENNKRTDVICTMGIGLILLRTSFLILPVISKASSIGAGGAGSSTLSCVGFSPYPCARSDTATNRNNRAPSVPGAGSVVVDPFAGGLVLRLTDTVTTCNPTVTPAGCNGLAYANGNVQSSSDLNPFSLPNSDAHKTYDLCVHQEGNSLLLYNFDPVTMTSRRIDKANGNSGSLGTNIPTDGDGSCEFSHITPRTLYGTLSATSTNGPEMVKYSYSYSGTPPVTWNPAVLRLNSNEAYIDTQEGHAGKGAFLPSPDAAPSSCTVSGLTSGGSLPDGTYYVACAYVAPSTYSSPHPTTLAAIESAPSSQQTITISGGGGNGSIQVTAIAAPVGTEKGYRVYAGRNTGHIALQAEMCVITTSGFCSGGSGSWSSPPSTTITGLQMYYNGTIGGAPTGCRYTESGGKWADAGSTACAISGRDLSANDQVQLISIGGSSQDLQTAQMVYNSAFDQADGVHVGARTLETNLMEVCGDWGEGASYTTPHCEMVTPWNNGTGMTIPATARFGINPTSGNPYAFWVHGTNLTKDGTIAVMYQSNDTGSPSDSATSMVAGSIGTQLSQNVFWQISGANLYVTTSTGPCNSAATDQSMGCNSGGHEVNGYTDVVDTGSQGAGIFRYHVNSWLKVQHTGANHGCYTPDGYYCSSDQINMNPNYGLLSGVNGNHSSWQQFTAASWPPVYSSMDWENSPAFGGPWEGEWIGVQTLGCNSNNCTGKIARFATNWSMGINLGGFDNTARGAASQDGRYAIFSSAWTGNQCLGTPNLCNFGIVAPSQPTVSATTGTLPAGTYYVVLTYVTPTVAAGGGNPPYGGETQGSTSRSITVGSNGGIAINYPASTAPKSSLCSCNAATSWNAYVGTSSSGPFYFQGSSSTFGTGMGFTLTSYTASGANPPTLNQTGSRLATPLGDQFSGPAAASCQLLAASNSLAADATCHRDVWLAILK